VEIDTEMAEIRYCALKVQ